MDGLCSAYREIFKLHDVVHDVNSEMIKKKIRENIPDVEFGRPKDGKNLK